jgi:hypothetical protein
MQDLAGVMHFLRRQNALLFFLDDLQNSLRVIGSKISGFG